MKFYSSITITTLIWLISILFISYLGFSKLPHSDLFKGDFFQRFANWDGAYYLSIAQFGYKEQSHYAFFPLYPLLIRGLNQITQNYLAAALIISAVCSFLGLQLLYKLIRLDFDKKLAEKTIISIIFFPTSFYFLTAYSESLFFFLVVITFYFLRTKKILLATLMTILASATRITGLALSLALMTEIYLTSGFNRKNWFVLLSPLGFAAYCLFLQDQISDPLYFLTAQLHWQRQISIPFLNFWDTLKSLTTPGFIQTNFNSILDLLFAIFGLGLALRSFRFLPISISVYAFISILIPLLTSTLMSMPRFLLPIFPIFILISQIKNKYWTLGYQIISLMLLSIFTVLFINGHWLA